LLWLFASDIMGGDDTSPTPTLVVVPNVVGERVRVAEETLTAEGLTIAEERIEVPIEDPATQVPGTVVEQDPAADQEVAEGTAVTLTVLVAPDSVTIPPTERLSPDEAQAALEAEGFVVAGFEDQASDTVPEGDVVGTDPAAGIDAPFNSEVTIFVSTGPGQRAVPDVVCFSLGQAKARIQDAGLEPVVADEQLPPNPLCPNGNKVVDTDPAANTPVEAGSQVLIFLPSNEAPTGPTGG
ncbi:MAG TPA: PASTA domain-containing protein, partial [Actinomycetota bacterium]|nr:PASTA domain-containing protein [Actinomycetota bacterium]